MVLEYSPYTRELFLLNSIVKTTIIQHEVHDFVPKLLQTQITPDPSEGAFNLMLALDFKLLQWHVQSDCWSKNDRARAAPRAVLSGFLLLLKMSDLI